MAYRGQTSNEGLPGHRPPPPAGSHRKIQAVRWKECDWSQYQCYTPEVVSIGPYNHGRRELRLAESFKPRALEMVLSGDKEKEDYYYAMIRDEIFYINSCYEEHPTRLYSDDELARMMLLDACFVIIHLETSFFIGLHPDQRQSDTKKMLYKNAREMAHSLGMSNMSCVVHDMFLLENQIPFWVVKLLLKSKYNENQIQELLIRYSTGFIYGEFPSRINLTVEYLDEVLHLLEAFYRLVVFGTNMESALSSQSKSRFRSCMNDLKVKASRRVFKNRDESNRSKVDLEKVTHSFGSVRDLKAKGVRFKPRQTLSLLDVTFESNCIYGKLQLPIWYVSKNTKVFFLNMIAYELSPNNHTQGVITTYINLMKSLIKETKDVKELREKKILLCSWGNDKQVLKIYQDINTHGVDIPFTFQT